MSISTQAQTAQKLDPTEEFLKEFEAKLPNVADKDKILSMAKKWLCASGHFLAMFEEFEICDELIKEALIQQKEIMSKIALSKARIKYINKEKIKRKPRN